MNEYTYIIAWTAVLIIMIVAEVISQGLTTVWFAIGAVVALILAALNLPLLVQIIVFLAVSIITLLYTRPIAVKHLGNKIVKTNIDDIIGKVGYVTESIDNIKCVGTVFLNGLEWTARTENDNVVINKDAKVEVVAIDGVKLIVKEAIINK